MFQCKKLSNGAALLSIRRSQFFLINPGLVSLVHRVPHMPRGGVLALDVAHKILEIQLRMRVVVQLATEADQKV